MKLTRTLLALGVASFLFAGFASAGEKACGENCGKGGKDSKCEKCAKECGCEKKEDTKK